MVKVIVGSGADHLRDKVTEMGGEVMEVDVKRFPDGEKYVRVMGGGSEVAVLQSTYRPQDENLMELMILGDALRERGFKKLRLIVPYLAYSRQDRVVREGEPVSVRAVMRMLGLYYDELYVFDIHNPETLRYFPGKAINLSPARLMAKYFKDKLGDGVVLAPDRGALGRARAIAVELDVEYSHFEKTRLSPTEVAVRPADVEVKDRNVLVVDDIISTGGTMVKVVKFLREMGASKVFVTATHGVFAEGAIEKVGGVADELAVTDTIPTPVSKISVVPEVMKVIR